MVSDRIIKNIKNDLSKNGLASIGVSCKLGSILLTGEVDDYSKVVFSGRIAAKHIKKKYRSVINDIKVKGLEPLKMRTPDFTDKEIDNLKPDVLIIGGGIVGCAIARELSKYDIDILLVEKEYDVATAQSSRNDGMIHAGIDLKPFSKKVKYNMRGNKLYDTVSKELDVPIDKVGQYVLLTSKLQKLIYPIVKFYGHINKIPTRYCTKKYVDTKIKNVGFKYGAFFCPNAGILNPFLTTIAFIESAIENGVRVMLNSAVTHIENDGKHIISVKTNRGTVYPKVVINAAGVFSDKISEMAGDGFFTIHPRRGVEAILDKKAKHLTDSVIGRFVLKSSSGKAHTKGGGIVSTVDGNILVGPTAVEVYERENTATTRAEINSLFDKHGLLTKDLKSSDIITYFAGTRAPNYEEEFIIEKSPVIDNLVVAAGIQSPGITAAPAIAEDITKFTISMLEKDRQISKKSDFKSKRTGILSVKDMDKNERDALIKKNPDYGVIVCRCEEISKGEILDALRSPLKVDTLDAIKRRVRPGMGRCQGGFCSPIITSIIAKEREIPLDKVNKKGLGGFILTGANKDE